MRTLTWTLGGAVMVWWMLAGAPAWAGTMETFDSASGPGLQSLSFNNFVLDTINNDNVVGASPNQILINQKAYGSSEYIDMDFTVADSGGTTEYILVEGLANNTADTWTGYRIVLGFGLGGSFVESASGDGLDFDSPDFDSPAELALPFFSTLTLAEDEILLSDGSMGLLSFSDLVFTVDVPDDISSFTIRQIPILVPEPSTGLLVALGLTVIGRARTSSPHRLPADDLLSRGPREDKACNRRGAAIST